MADESINGRRRSLALRVIGSSIGLSRNSFMLLSFAALGKFSVQVRNVPPDRSVEEGQMLRESYKRAKTVLAFDTYFGSPRA